MVESSSSNTEAASLEDRREFISQVPRLIEGLMLENSGKIIQLRPDLLTVILAPKSVDPISRLSFMKSGEEFILSSHDKFSNPLAGEGLWNPKFLTEDNAINDNESSV